MRVEKDYIGVSFLNPDLSAVQTLHKFASSNRIQDSDANEDFGTTQTVFNGKSSAIVVCVLFCQTWTQHNFNIL